MKCKCGGTFYKDFGLTNSITGEKKYPFIYCSGNNPDRCDGTDLHYFFDKTIELETENATLKAEVERLTARVKELEDTLKRAIEFAETGWGGNAERLIMGKPKEETK